MRFTKEDIEKRRKKVDNSKKILRYISYLILIPIIIYNSLLIIQAANNSSETPSVAGIKTFVIISGSMEPELKIGDIVLIKKCEELDIQIGDIISFRSGESIITHRVNDIVVDNNGKIQYETKGDNNNIVDTNYVKYDDIEGKMIKKILYIGKMTLLLKNKMIIILILLSFYIIYVHNVNVEEKRMIRKEKRKILKEKYNRNLTKNNKDGSF